MGRPRRLTLERILEAVDAIGLDRFEMAQLAQHLGVGVGTLYGYVSSREQLLALAAGRHARKPTVVDTGQSWDQALREHAAATFDSVTSNPQVLVEFARGALPLDDEPAFRAPLIRLLTDRGFSDRDALALYHEANMAVLGAAALRAHLRQGREPVQERPLPPSLTYHPALERLIAEYAAPRGRDE